MENYKNILVDKKRFKIPEGYFDRFELNNINIKKDLDSTQKALEKMKIFIIILFVIVFSLYLL